MVMSLAFGGALGLGSEAKARELNHRSDNEWTSTQKASLGNIGVLSENFSDHFFSDPSLQARKRSNFDLQIVSLNAYATDDLGKTSADVQDFLKEVKTQSESETGASLEQGLDALEFIASLTGRRAEAGATINLIALRVGRFSFVPYVNLFAKAHIDVPSWPQAQILVENYSAIGLGYSHPIGKSLDVGMNLRPGLRAYLRRDISASTLDIETPSSGGGVQTPEQDLNPSLGVFVPVDVGAGYQVNAKVRAHLVARNLYGGGVSNLAQEKDGRRPGMPPEYPLQVATGATWGLFERASHRVRVATEWQDILETHGMDDLLLRWQWAGQYLYSLSSRKQTTFGMNVGLQSGYPSLGFVLDLFLCKIEAAYFVFEGGAAAGQKAVPAKSLRIFSEISL